MKCDELESYYYYEDRVFTPATHTYRVYHADEVDEAIAELKADNESLKAKLADAMATAAFNYLDAVTRERRLRRALWLARAERAKEKQQLLHFSLGYEKLCIDGFYDPYSGRKELSPIQWIKVFNKVETKCLKKAEEYR